MEEKNKNSDLLQLEDLASRSELAVANKVTTMALTILCSIVSVAYLAEIAKGNRTVGYVAVTVILCMTPVILGWTIYNKDRNSVLLKRVIAIGFAIMYIFVLFTKQNDLVFCYAIPMLIVTTLYGDLPYTIRIGIGVIVVNIAAIVIQFVTTDVAAEQIVTAEIQALVMVMIVIYLIWVAKATSQFENIRKARLELEKRKTEELLGDVLSVSGKMTGTVSDVAKEMQSLKASVDQTLTSMTEVNSGTNESAEAVQNQMVKTGEIQQYIGNVERVADTINENVTATSDAVSEGQKHINRMDGLTNQVDKAGKDVADALHSFQEITSKMNSITDMITQIAAQTRMLSLNASIEAARAGEAGRGFAVVATEISSLSDQTTQATNDINTLIGSIASQLDAMVDTIEHLLKVGEEESSCAEETSQSFTMISRNVEEILKHSDELGSIVKDLAKANDEIVSNVETISAMTEEVTAHANETYSSSELNQEIVTHINALVDALNENAEELKAHS